MILVHSKTQLISTPCQRGHFYFLFLKKTKGSVGETFPPRNPSLSLSLSRSLSLSLWLSCSSGGSASVWVGGLCLHPLSLCLSLADCHSLRQTNFTGIICLWWSLFVFSLFLALSICAFYGIGSSLFCFM